MINGCLPHSFLQDKMINEDTKTPLFSRKTTRVAVESPIKAHHKSGAHHLGLTVPARLPGSRLSKLSFKPFDPEDDYVFDSTDGN